MWDLIAIAVTVIVVAGMVALMERTHRRTRGLPRAPFRVDLDGNANADYRREVAELRAAADRGSAKAA